MSLPIPVTFRRARRDDSGALTALALRSKAHWGYDEAFLAAVHADMIVAPELLARSSAFVAMRGVATLGFYVLCIEPEGPTLRDLWVEPSAIGTGVGARLWGHMLMEAQRQGFRVVWIVSDPHAAGFYLRMGARSMGERASCVIAGRFLPLFAVDVPGVTEP